MTAKPEELGYERPQLDALARRFSTAGIGVIRAAADRKQWTLSYGGTAVTYWPLSGRCWAFGKSFTPDADRLIAALLEGKIQPTGPNYRHGQRCRSCKAPIVWYSPPHAADHSTGESPRRHPAPHPCNPDGTSHFATCPSATDHRSPARRPADNPSSSRHAGSSDRALSHISRRPGAAGRAMNQQPQQQELAL